MTSKHKKALKEKQQQDKQKFRIHIGISSILNTYLKNFFGGYRIIEKIDRIRGRERESRLVTSPSLLEVLFQKLSCALQRFP